MCVCQYEYMYVSKRDGNTIAKSSFASYETIFSNVLSFFLSWEYERTSILIISSVWLASKKKANKSFRGAVN